MNEALITFIRGIQPVSIFEAAGELATLGEHGAAWPRASAEHWRRELTKLVNDGWLTETNGMLSVAVQRGDTPTQGMLF